MLEGEWDTEADSQKPILLSPRSVQMANAA
jgi:hypothetical protein